MSNEGDREEHRSIDSRLSSLESTVDQMDQRLGRVEDDIRDLRTEMNNQFEQQRTEMNQRFEQQQKQNRRMFALLSVVVIVTVTLAQFL